MAKIPRHEVPEDFLDKSLIRWGPARAVTLAGFFGGAFIGYLLAFMLGLPQAGLLWPLFMLSGGCSLLLGTLTIRKQGLSIWQRLLLIQFEIRMLHWHPQHTVSVETDEPVRIVITHRHGAQVFDIQERSR